jgi:AcrR family transcriptional regulator
VPSSQPRPPRRRESSRLAILEAALSLCRAEGYAKLTIEAIAARARVGKQTIYRWWPSKAAVVLEAFLESVRPEVPFPDTGDLVADFRAVVTDVVRLCANSDWGPHLAALIAEAQHDPAVGPALQDGFLTPRRALLAERLHRAEQLGQLPASLPTEAVLDVVFGAIYHRLLLRNAPLDRAYAADIVNIVFAGSSAWESSPLPAVRPPGG